MSFLLKIITILSIIISFSFSKDRQPLSDDLLLVRLIEKAYHEKKTLKLKKNKVYKIFKPLQIKCSINGNGAKIVPTVKKTIAVSFVEDGITIDNLKIIGNGFKMIDVPANNVKINNCEFETHNYFVLLRLSGSGFTVRNSTLSNCFKKKRNYVIKNKYNESVDDLFLEKSNFNGGFYFANPKDTYCGNYIIKNNVITVDYTSANQNIKKQNDAFHFSGINKVKIESNNIKLINVTRGFKLTDNKHQKGKKVSKLPVKDFYFLYNKISSNSKNGKQLFDFFDGTSSAIIKGNEIYSRGHTTIFEDKTTFALNEPRKLIIDSNKVYFDFRLIYFRGAKKSDFLNKDVSLLITQNDFYFTQEKFQYIIKRIGSEKDIKLEFPIYVRSINSFNFHKNSLYSLNIKNAFKKTRFLNIYDVISSSITKNSFSGGVLYSPTKRSSLNFEKNKIMKNEFKKIIKTRFIK